MKTILRKQLLIFQVLFGIVFTANAQIYSETLEEVVLNTSEKAVVLEDTFTNYQAELVAKESLSFPKEIRTAKATNEVLIFSTTASTTEILKTKYLKLIRKAANRSNNPDKFRLFLENRLPKLKNQHLQNEMLVTLYNVSRKATFNGRLDALPSVI